MSTFGLRAERAAALAQQRELDLLLVSNLVNVRYLGGFRGTNGLCLIGLDRRTFITDFRYVERARSEVPDYDIVRGKQDLLESVVDVLKESSRPLRLGFDDADLTVKAHRRLTELLPPETELVAASGLVEELRAVKEDGELASIRQAAELTDHLYRWLTEEFGLAGRTEAEVARALERRAEDSGADAAFPAIVAAAENGALPHASSRDVPIERDTLVVVDFGCRIDDYNSDCTRTFSTGSLDSEATEIYEIVRSAQEAAVDAVRAGAAGKAVDAVARAPIERAGRGDQFGHGTGHGVGLEVHEAPRLAPTAEGSLAPGNVVTVEPGVYVPGRFGVRIEDLVAVGADGCERLTSLSRELVTV